MADNLNLKALSLRVAAELDAPKGRTYEALRGMFQEIANTASKGGKARIAGFGTFDKRFRKAKLGRNPKTGEKLPIPPSSTLGFKAVPALKVVEKAPKKGKK